MPFHIDGRKRARRTEVLTGSATDAAFGVNDRYLQGFRIIRIRGNHFYGIRRTMAGTVTALDTVGQRDAIRFHPHGMTDLDGRFICFRYQCDGSCRTDLGAFCTLGAAVTTFVRHFRLHQSHQITGRTQDVIRTGRDTELAGCAMMPHILYALCAGGGQ